MFRLSNLGKDPFPESPQDIRCYVVKLRCDIRAGVAQSRALLRESREILREISCLKMNYEYSPVAPPDTTAPLIDGPEQLNKPQSVP